MSEGSNSPRTPTEQLIAALWQELFNLESIKPDDDLLSLGGNSLIAMSIVSEIRDRLGVEVALSDVFGSTFAKLVALIENQRPGEQVAITRPRLGPRNATRARLLAPQRGTFLLDRNAPAGKRLRYVSSIWLEGPLDVAALKLAVPAMRERHSILRARFFEADGDVWQEITDTGAIASSVLEIVDLTHLTGDAQGHAMHEYLEAFVDRPFVLADGEVMRISLVALTPTRHRLTLCFHRVVCDPESMRIFTEELFALWGGTALGAPSIQYIDLADYLAELATSEAGGVQRGYWTKLLAGTPPLALPTSRPREPLEAIRDETGGFVAFPAASVAATLSQDVAAAIGELAQETRASALSTMLAALGAFLRPLVQQDDLAIVSHLIYRHLPGLERAIGLFSNPLVMRLSVAGRPTFRELIRRVHEEVMGAYEHGEFDVLGTASHRMFRLWFNYMYIAPSTAELVAPPGLVATTAPEPGRRMPNIGYDLILFVTYRGDGCDLRLAYNMDLFDQAAAVSLLSGYVDALGRLVLDPDHATE